ncbi:amidohydrolase family protein [Cellulomonas fengjieae]|uniref:Amidohydrolase n=1 Tax=Cellulomonas fengjieae TaxID=2819978 RepID=A0ABS3SG45_9CELL|nr:amidohydrolase family protein [Cellulomonas fengjieae]MBO3084732.1 amidohydrolase [Cellulomonas fengjieae]QVI66946.1 amidohydrolase [Cellulomonas fengjieae]
MIIDFHTHVDEAEAFGWIDPPEKIVGLLDEAGIDKAVIMTYTDLPGTNPGALEYIVDAAAQFPDRLVPFVRLNPNYTAAMTELVERAVELGVRGVKLHPTTTLAHPAGDATVAVLRASAQAGLPVLFHCGDDPYTTPQTLGLAAQAVPECAIVFGHMGGYFHVRDAIDTALRLPNVYLETSAMPRPEMIRTAVGELGAHRVIFGSDGPGCNPRLELAKITSLGLPAADEQAILGGNAARLMEVSAA